MTQPDLFAPAVAVAPTRPIPIEFVRYRTDQEGKRPFLLLETRVKMPGQETPRLVELIMSLTPYGLAALLREGQRTLESMGHSGELRGQGEPTNGWTRTTGVKA